jgi:hypothetical protein
MMIEPYPSGDVEIDANDSSAPIKTEIEAMDQKAC